MGPLGPMKLLPFSSFHYYIQQYIIVCQRPLYASVIGLSVMSERMRGLESPLPATHCYYFEGCCKVKALDIFQLVRRRSNLFLKRPF
jgi:hypothetical protein